MLQPIRLAALAATALVALPALAMAGGPRSMNRGACRVQRTAALLPTYDTNRNGSIDPQERQALKRDKRRDAVARYDVNGNRKIDEAERVRMRADHVQTILDKTDRNHDGHITRAEANVACSGVKRRFDAIDANHNDRINKQELLAAGPMKHRNKGWRARLRRAGRDGHEGRDGRHMGPRANDRMMAPDAVDMDDEPMGDM